MKYRVSIEGQEHEVDVQITPGGAVTVALDGTAVDAEATPVPGGVSLRMNGRIFDVVVGGSAEQMTVACGEHRTTLAVESERARARRRAAGAKGRADKELRAPMPGRVLKVLVAAGDEVDAEQPLVVIEAMKMENELRASGPGKVDSVAVKEGQAVEGNSLLLTFA